MGVILLSFGIFINKIIYHVVAFKKVNFNFNSNYSFFLLWAELAVGLFNSPFLGVNLYFDDLFFKLSISIL